MPYFGATYPIIEKILIQLEINLASFLEYQLICICEYLGLVPRWFNFSKLKKSSDLRGQDKIIRICKEVGATQYINMISGKSLYDQQFFNKMGAKAFVFTIRPN